MKRWILLILTLLMAWPLAGVGEESALPEWCSEDDWDE